MIKEKKKMIEKFRYIVVCGIIIVVGKFSGSEWCG